MIPCCIGRAPKLARIETEHPHLLGARAVFSRSFEPALHSDIHSRGCVKQVDLYVCIRGVALVLL